MRLDPAVLADLAVSFLPRAYTRVTPLAFRATPLGMGFGRTRFSSPDDRFKVLYIAEDLATGLAETLVRDRFVGRRRRRIGAAEITAWGATEVEAVAPLILIDLRTTGLLRLGVTTDAARGRTHRSGRRLSAAIHETTDADGILYRSRLTNALCCVVYERAVSKLAAGPVADLATIAGSVPALAGLGVAIVTSG